MIQGGRRYPIKVLTTARARKIIKPYAERIGAIAINWNWLHETLAQIFEVVVDSKNARLAQAVWYAAENDHVQRKMLRDALNHSKLNQTQKTGIKYLLDTIENPFRHSRNAALHAPLIFMISIVDELVQTSLAANFASESPRAKALHSATDNLESELDHYAMVAERLTDHARLIQRALLIPEQQPWPEKPNLQRAPRKKKGRGSKGDHKPDPES